MLDLNITIEIIKKIIKKSSKHQKTTTNTSTERVFQVFLRLDTHMLNIVMSRNEDRNFMGVKVAKLWLLSVIMVNLNALC
jgi:hypothetical protein